MPFDSPAERGEFRVFNQFTESFSVGQLADMVVAAYGGDAVIEHVPHPRVEKEDHYYRAAHTKLLDLGLVPHLLSSSVIKSMLEVCDRYKANVNPEAILPTVEWRATSSNLVTAGSGEPLPVEAGQRLTAPDSTLTGLAPARPAHPVDSGFRPRLVERGQLHRAAGCPGRGSMVVGMLRPGGRRRRRRPSGLRHALRWLPLVLVRSRRGHRSRFAGRRRGPLRLVPQSH